MKATRMMMFLLLAAVMAVGCGKTSYKKTPGGMPYKLYPGKDTLKIQAGNYVKLSVTQKLNDSVLFTTDNGMPVYLMISGQQTQPYDISELWLNLKLNDSVVATQMVDTFLKRAPDRMPPSFKKGDRIFTYLKVLKIFSSDSLAKIDEEIVRKEFIAAESKVVEKYLADKKINVQKTPSGAFVEVIKQGDGPEADSGNYVSVNYTGVSWKGEKFDSNTDSTFGHVGPYSFTAGAGEMIKGFDEAIQMMRKGGKVKAYVPSSLAYGPNGNPPKIKPYENLIFDLELVDVKDKAPAQPVMPPPPPPQRN